MNDDTNFESPVRPQTAPDHGPDFWDRFESAVAAEAGPRSQARPESGTTARTSDATAQMPRLTAVDGRETALTAAPAPAVKRSRSTWPLAAAAAVLVMVGLGFLVARGTSDPATTTTEIVAAPSTVADAASADGSGQDDGDVEDVDPAADQEQEAEPAPVSGGADGDQDPEDDADAGTSTDSDETSADAATVTEPRPTVAPIPDFAQARGATGDPDYLPLDQGIPADGTYLANWPERGLTWYAVADPSATCASPGYSELRYVNASGITQPIRDPQLYFSGEISHFVVRNEQHVAAWVVACGQQLELHVATLEPTGRIDTPTLVWIGEGSTSSALVLWEADTVSFNAIEPGGDAFSVEYDIETGLLSRNGGPSRIMLEAGAPAERSLTPLAASPDGGLTYWQGTAEPGTVSECAALYGSGQSDMLWLRQGEGQWLPAVEDSFPVGSITAAALDSASLQFAFADLCAGSSGRVVIGTQLPDGRIGDVIEIDLTPFVPGYAARLFWVDDTTLRIETDNAEFGFGQVRFDYRLDQGVIVQLD